MPVLHFRIKKQNDNIDLSRTLQSQNITLRRIIKLQPQASPQK